MPRHGWLTSALLLALVVNVAVAWRSPVIAVDGTTFIGMARDLPRAPLVVMREQDQHPGYPALIAVAHALLPSTPAPQGGAESPAAWVFAARFVSGACGLGVVVLVWLLAQNMYDQRTADIAALFAAALPVYRQNAADVLSDTPHLCCYLLAAWLLSEGIRRRSVAWFAAAGVASGLAYWVRPEGLSVALVGCTLAIVVWPWAVGMRLRQSLCMALVLACSAAAVTMPYLAATGKLTKKKNPLAAQQKPESFTLPYISAPIASASLDQSSAPSDEFLAAPLPTTSPRPTGPWRLRLAGSIKKFLVEVSRCFAYVPGIFWLLGHFAPGRPRADRAVLWLLAALGTMHTLLVLWLGATAGYLGHRHVMPIVAVAIPAAAAGVEYAARRATEFLRRPLLARSWALATALTLVAIATPFAWRTINTVSTPVVDASRWVRAHAAPNDTLLANSAYAHFYSGLPGPTLGIQVIDLRAGLAAYRPRFLVLEVDTRAYSAPAAERLGPEYELAHRTAGAGERSWHQVVVYQRASQNARTATPGQPRR